MPPPPRMHKPNATIILKIETRKRIWNLKKKNLSETISMIYNTLQFDQYPHLAIRLYTYFSVFGQNFENEFEVWKKLSISL